MKTAKQVALLTLVLTTLILIACSDLEETIERTKQMADTTADMKLSTEILLRDARQGGAQEQRREALRDLLTEDRALELRLKDSAVYFRAFEFQIWENILQDDEAHRQYLLRDAAEEFMITFRGLIDGKRKEPNPLSTKAKMQQTLAMSATVEQINTIQVEAAARNPFQVVSMFDLVIQALRLKSATNNGIAVPPYVLKILAYEDEALYLLELRYNMLPAIVLDKIFDVSQMGIISQLKLLLSKKDVVVDFANINAVELNELTNNYISGAIFARNFSNELGAPIKMKSSVMKILKKATFKEDPTAGPGKAASIANFKTAFAQLLCESGSCK